MRHSRADSEEWTCVCIPSSAQLIAWMGGGELLGSIFLDGVGRAIYLD